MNYDIFIPVRLDSTRLLNKALLKVQGKPVLSCLLERLRDAKKIRYIIICTTNSDSENELIQFCKENNILVFRGSTDDILVRYLDASKKFQTDFIISVDGDDIYTDPSYIDKLVEEHEKTKSDYIEMIGLPFGLCPVGFTTEALKKLCKLKKTNNTATGYKKFFTETNLFRVQIVKPKSNIKFSKKLRLSLDYMEDYELAKKVFEMLGNNFRLDDILNLFQKKPYLLEITKNIEEEYMKHWENNVADFSIKNN